MPVTWPTTPDTLPKPGALTYEDDTGYYHDELHADVATLLERLESQVGGNLFVNANYDHWQETEGASGTCTTTFSGRTSFPCDRFFTLPAGASVSVIRSTTVPDTQSRFSCAITGAASVTTVDHGQRIRSAYRTQYKKSLVWAAYVRNESGAAYTPTLRVDTPAAADDWTTPTNRLSQTLQSCPDSAWTLIYHVFDPTAYPNVDNGLSVYLRIPSGSSVAGDVSRIAQHRLVPGVAVSPYLAPDSFIERIRCLTYRRKTYSDGTAPATDTTAGIGGGGFAGSGGTNGNMPEKFGIPMWKVPTISLYGKAGGANKFWNGVSDNDFSIASFIGTNGFTLGNSSTTAEQVFAHYVAVAELT